MKLNALASEPQLIKVVIDDEKTLAKYGESVDYWMYDRQDLDTYMQLASVGDGKNVALIANVVKELVLDENGVKVLTGKNLLPVDIMVRVVEETVKRLGNQETPTSETQIQS